MLALGAAVAAFAIEEFLVPCTILDGGVVGVSIIVNNLTNIRLSLLTLVLNIPFLIVGYKVLGKEFLVKAGFSMIMFSSFLEVFAPMTDATHEYLLAVCFGGIILGIGVGIVISFGGCLDGTETVAILLNRKFNFPVGRTVLFFNIIIYAVAGRLFGFERAMYSLLTYYITSKVLDFIDNGMNQAKAAMIITNEGREIADMIYKQMGRTVTIMEGAGLISGKKDVLYCVLNRLEIYELKKLINEADTSAFIAINEVSEIIGNHIKMKGSSD
ncbi:MAG: YitT family protein [Lachnospiraceae bacterium]|nr:YitT family protein [Lachnospiraceae bacterium]